MTKAPDPKRAESGRKGGIASGEARRKRRSRTLIDVIRARVSKDPDAVAERLLTTAAGSVLAVRLLEASGDFKPPKAEQPAEPWYGQHDREVILAELHALGLVVPATDSESPSARELPDEDCNSSACPRRRKPKAP